MADRIEFNKPIKVSDCCAWMEDTQILDNWTKLRHELYCFYSQPVKNENGSNFLLKWASDMRTKTPTKANKPFMDTDGSESMKVLFSTKHQFPMPMSPVLPETSLRQLQHLMYAKQSDSQKETVGTLPSKSMETHFALAARQNASNLKKTQKIKADLSDVSLDD